MKTFYRIKVLTLILGFSSIIMATSSVPIVDASLTRSHVVASINRSGTLKNLHGGSMYSSVPNVTSNWTSNNGAFIAKTMWININGDYGDWVENGYFQGADINGNYYDGFYYAYGLSDSAGRLTNYQEYKVIGPSKTIGAAHTHVIKYLGDGVYYWKSTINGSYSLDFYGWAGDGDMDVGVETNNAVAKLNSVTNTSGLKWFENNTWYDWNSSAKIITQDYLNTGIRAYWNGAYTSVGIQP